MNIRKSFVAVLAALVSVLGMAETATVDGLLWQYSVAGGAATVEKLLTPGVENVVIPSEINGAKVEVVGAHAFMNDEDVGRVIVPEGVSVIEERAFSGCLNLLDIKLPSTLKEIGDYAFWACKLRYVRLPRGLKSIGAGALTDVPGVMVVEGASFSVPDSYRFTAHGGVEFLSCVPQGLLGNELFTSASDVVISYPKKYAEEWSKIVPPEKFAGYIPESICEVSVSSKMRECAPAIMDVKILPVASKPEVKIYPIAFLNGINSFANVVKVKTFVDETESVVQNPVKVNQESVFSWNVAADLTNKVARLKMDVMCVEDEVIPLELVSIPASSGHVAMTISRNVIAPMHIRDGLMCLLAAPSKGVRINVTEHNDTGGVTKSVEVALLKGETVILSELRPLQHFKLIQDGDYDFQLCDKFEVKKFVLEELGYTILEGDNLEYARKMTGLKLENGPYVKMK